MKIDTTATILKLSSLLAASAGVAAPSQAAGTVSGTPAAVTTTSGAPNQKPLSFQQLLAQIQEAAANASKPAAPASQSQPDDAPAPPAKDASEDPAEISNALLALLSQSNQPAPTPVPVAATPPSTQPVQSQPTAAVGATPAQPGGVPTVATGCPPAMTPGTKSDPSPQPATQSNGKTEAIDLKSPTPVPTGDVPSTALATPPVATADTKVAVDASGLTANAADQPLAATEPTQSDKASETDTTPASTALNEAPVIDVKAVDSKAADVRIQPADATATVQETKASVAKEAPEKISGTVARHTRDEVVQAANSTAGNSGRVDLSNLINEFSEAVVEASSDAVEPVSEVADDAKSKETSDSTAIESGMPGETANGVTDIVTAADPASQTASVDAHNLAHHLEAMAMQRLDQPESSDRASVVLRLDPPELGRVNVHMSVANDVVSIRMVTSGDAARQVIEQQLNQLQQSLTDKGISFQDFQVQTGGGSQQQQQSSHQGFAKHWADNSGYSAFGGRRSSTAASTPQILRENRAQLDYVA